MGRGQHPPDILPDRLWGLLNRWAEWRSVIGYPKSMRLPEPTQRWEFAGQVLRGSLGFCLIPSTAPKAPGKVEEFNLAFLSLDIDQQAYVLALVELQGEPWLEGSAWRRFLSALSLTRDQYERLLRSALRRLARAARKRGLI